MSKGERIAAITGVWAVVALAAVLNFTWPWFRYHLASLQWITGVITGWLFCSAINRKSR